MVKDLADLFQRLIGGTLMWFVLRDREAAMPRVRQHVKEQATRRGIVNFHVWERYALENYLVDVPTVVAAIRAEAATRQLGAPGEDVILRSLELACDEVLREARTTFVTSTQNYFIRHDLRHKISGRKPSKKLSHTWIAALLLTRSSKLCRASAYTGIL